MWTLKELFSEFELSSPTCKIGIATGKVVKNVELSKNAQFFRFSSAVFHDPKVHKGK